MENKPVIMQPEGLCPWGTQEQVAAGATFLHSQSWPRVDVLLAPALQIPRFPITANHCFSNGVSQLLTPVLHTVKVM